VATAQNRELQDWIDEKEFIRKAVMLVYNECPERPFREFKPGDYSYSSELYHRASAAMEYNGPGAPASYAERLKTLAPKERQILIQYAIWQTLYWDDNRYPLTTLGRELFGPDVIGEDITERFVYGGMYGAELTYGLSSEQKQMLAKVAQAIEEETINRLAKLGDTNRR
jgi:hypothetical protein